jgi:hypothetical protein
VNSQNNWYWSVENQRLIHKPPLHDEEIGVWCAISARRIIGSIFYNDTVNGARYMNNILSSLLDELTEEERLYVFQQDCATANMAHVSLEALWEVFGDHVISHGLWPPCSSDLTSCDFYLCESSRDNMYKTNPHTLDALRNNNHHEISAISGEELQRVNNNVFRRYTECIQSGGQNFQHTLSHR